MATVGLSSTAEGRPRRPGKPWIVTIRVLQHGRTPMSDAKPEVRIRNAAGKLFTFKAKKTATSSALPGPGRLPEGRPLRARRLRRLPVAECARVHTFKSVADRRRLIRSGARGAWRAAQATRSGRDAAAGVGRIASLRFAKPLRALHRNPPPGGQPLRFTGRSTDTHDQEGTNGCGRDDHRDGTGADRALARRGARARRVRVDRRLAAAPAGADVDLHYAIDLLRTAALRSWRSRSCSSRLSPRLAPICARRQNALCRDTARVDPLTVLGHARPRARHDPHVRPDAAGRDRRLHRITGTRWVARGGDWDLIFRVAVWGVGAGIVGARLYHLATSWSEVPDEWWGPFAVWEGGLGIWGGIAGGVLVGGIVAHRAGASVTALLDAAAPGLLVAQAIGRIGNWWNQELFGEPTDRPVGARDRRRPPARRVHLRRRRSIRRSSTRRSGTSCAAGLLLLLDRRFTFRPPALFALYISLYTGFRFYLESIRVDPSDHIVGLRVNAWVSLILFIGSTAVLHLLAVLPRPPRQGEPPRRPAGASSRRRRWPSRAGRVRPRR